MNGEFITFRELISRMPIDLEGGTVDFMYQLSDSSVSCHRGILAELECWPNGSLKQIGWNRNQEWNSTKRKWKSFRTGWWVSYKYEDLEYFVGPCEVDGKIVFAIDPGYYIIYPQRIIFPDEPTPHPKLRSVRQELMRTPARK